ncbi:MAG: uracil-xanthine permease family protein [Magnetospiraceae bacterium]
MAGRKANLIFGVDDHPALGTLLFLGFQHLIVLTSVGLLFPLLVARSIDLGAAETIQFISLSLLVTGVGTILQALRGRLIGSGFLAPTSIGSPWLPASILAAKTGGLSLVAGMTLVSGFGGIFLARLLPRLRVVFPPEVTGTVTLMVGVSLILPAMHGIFATDLPPEAPRLPSILTGAATLAVFVGIGAWAPNSRLRLFLPVLAISVGGGVAAMVGLIRWEQFTAIAEVPIFAIPRPAPWGWSFDLDLLVPFLVAAVGVSLKTMGDITACQKINDPGWKRPDIDSISGGVMVNGLTSLFSGCLGTMGTQTLSANVGLSLATGATARTIGFSCGGMVILMAFLPKAAALFTLLPGAILGALLVYPAAFLMVTGMEIVTSRMLDMRRTFIVALPIILGLGEAFSPALLNGAPDWLRTIFSSPLSIATILVVLLNILLRLGTKFTVSLSLVDTTTAAEKASVLLARQGAAWGARHEVIHQAEACLRELFESIDRQGLSQSGVSLVLSFHETSLEAVLRYRGEALEISSRPPLQEEMIEDPLALERMATYIASTYASMIEARQVAAQTEILLTFDH